VVPFEISRHRLRFTPALPRVSRFPELNVRTYATYDGVPGVWFFSLDATSALAVWSARRTYFLPYFKAEMAIAGSDEISYRSTRPDARFNARYGPTGSVYRSRPGTLEHWLTARFSLFAEGPKGRILRADIRHVDWPLQPAWAEIESNAMSPVALPDEPPLLHFARRVDVHIWPPRRA
jgi:uncharacterized protein